MADETVELIGHAVRRFTAEVPALAPIKLVAALELRGRGDAQHFRIEMPAVKVTRQLASDARVRVSMRREFFNIMAAEAKVPDWIEAFTYGRASASGPSAILQLIENVVERSEERRRARRRTRQAP